jgi:DNA-binding PadR family transcriptional regulator
MPPRDPAAVLPLGTDVCLVLLALGTDTRHGYGILREIEARTDGAVVPQTGALYRTLKHLLADGLIEEAERPRDAATDDDRRRYYRLTSFGRAVLEAEVARMARLVRAARLTMAGKRPRLA